MSEVAETIGGFRSAIQDLLVPELKAVQAEIRNVKETLDRHEKWLERLDQNLLQSNREQAERFEALSKDSAERFEALTRNFAERIEALSRNFAERFEALSKDHAQKFSSILESIRELQKNMAVVMSRLEYGERITKLETQMARLTKPRKSKGGRLSL